MPSQRLERRPAPRSVENAPTPPAWAVGPQWAQLGVRQPGWRILPLRGFLAVTFIYAGLQKLANPAYLNPSNHSSVVGQIQLLRHASPIGPLLGLSLHAPTLVGLLIAFGELAVGVGVLVGLWTRFAAVGGMLLSLTFFLTVSWSTTPYYYGSDIGFFFAWSFLAGLGAGGVLSLDGWLHSRARQLSGLRATPATFAVDARRLHALCSRDNACGLRPDSGCSQLTKCPLFGGEGRGRADVATGVDRRRLLLGARAAAIVAIATVGAGAATALLGRLAGGTGTSHPDALTGTTARSRRHHGPVNNPGPSGSGANGSASGVVIGSASAVPVGQAARFTDPASGGPAWLVHPRANSFAAFSAVCTHAGCPVGYDASSMEFVCPCHGGTFDAKTGRVLAGPPPRPLPSIPVHVVNGKVRVD